MLWFMSLYYEISIAVLSLFFLCCYFSLSTFTHKLCLQFWGLRMRNFTWNRFPIKNLLIDSLLTPIVESTYLKLLSFTYLETINLPLILLWKSHIYFRWVFERAVRKCPALRLVIMHDITWFLHIQHISLRLSTYDKSLLICIAKASNVKYLQVYDCS